MKRKYSHLSYNPERNRDTRKTLGKNDNGQLNTVITPNYKITNFSDEAHSVKSTSNISSKLSKTEEQHSVPKAIIHNTYVVNQRYFDDEVKLEQTDLPKSEIKSKIETVSESNIKDETSDCSKMQDDTSITTSTKVPGKDDRESSHGFKIVECLLNNTFIKLSDFTDIIGRKIIFAVDWDYMERQWKFSHAYLKDKLLELLFAYSLMDDFIQEENNEFKPTDNPYQFKDTINKMLSDNNILYHLMVESFGIEEDYAEQILKMGYDQSRDKSIRDKSDQVGWDNLNWKLREYLWSMIKHQEAYECELICIKGSYHGRMFIFEAVYDKYLYFRTYWESDSQDFKYLNDMFKSPRLTRRDGWIEFLINLKDINEVVAKNFLLRPHAIEIYESKNSKTYFLNLFSKEARSEVFRKLSQLDVFVVEDCRTFFKKMKYEEKWVKSKISSFDYLMLVNKYASRSFNDTSQYPIMPWIGPCGWNKKDEFNKSENEAKSNNNLDIVQANSIKPDERFRDLLKTWGVLGEEKQKLAEKKYQWGAQKIEAPIYGEEPYNLKFGYMNTQVCLSYLVRIEPYTSLFIDYNGKLDHADRMLSNWVELWIKVRSTEQWNNELIPEWFYLPQIFTNKNYCDYGIDSDGNSVCDVILPEWANK